MTLTSGAQPEASGAEAPPVWRRVGVFARDVVAFAKLRALTALVFQLIVGMTEGISILLFIPAIDLINPGGGLQADSVVTRWMATLFSALHIPFTLPMALFLCMGLIIARSLLVRWRGIQMSMMCLGYIESRRVSLFSAIIGARWSYTSQRRSADMTAVLTNQISRIDTGLTAMLQIAQIAILGTVYAIVSCFVSPLMTAVVIGSGVLIFVCLAPMRRASLRIGHAVVRDNQGLLHIITEFLGSLKVAKSFQAEDKYLGMFERVLSDMKRQHLAYVKTNSESGVAFQIAGALTLSAYVLIGVNVAHLTTAELIVLIFVFARLAPMFPQLQTNLQQLLYVMPSFETVRTLETSFRAAAENWAPGGSPVEMTHEISFKDVNFTYGGQGNARAVDGASFTIPAGRITALVGPSGSGKSTIADLLLGLLSPDEGEITVDGVPLSQDRVGAWRSTTAYVPQDGALINDTIRANLTLGGAVADDGELWRVLTLSAADGFVSRLAGGLNAMVGERGATLSGGERQRLALARALLRGPALIVLDEATSALDGGNQATIASTLSKLRGGMTIVTIAHRPSMISLADWIVVLEHGRVVEQGECAVLAGQSASRLSHQLDSEMALGDAAMPEAV